MCVCVCVRERESFPRGTKVLKNYLLMQETEETWIQSLSRDDPPEGDMATHSSILAWRIPWTEEPGLAKSQT